MSSAEINQGDGRDRDRSDGPVSPNASSDGPVGSPPEREIALAELRRHDGDQAAAWVACDGLVYDVSRSPEWRGGLHRRLHWAGQDLSSELRDAPHGRETLERCPLVGRLAAG